MAALRPLHASALLVLALSAPPALADGKRAAPPNAAYGAECGSCHVAYAPGLMPASSWRALMAGLGRHFGTDASLEPGLAGEIGAYLEAHAATGKRAAGAAASLRLTESTWFQRKHREVSAAAWKRPAVGGAGNCAACHPAASAGRFDEHAVRIPG